MKALDSIAQSVWAAATVEDKRALVCEMIDQFQHKAKVDEFKRQVMAMTTKYKLDNFAAQLELRNGNKVIK